MAKQRRRWKDLSKAEKAILITLIGGAIVFNPMGGKVVVSLAAYYIKKWWEKGGPYVPPEEAQQFVDTLSYFSNNGVYAP